MQFDAQQEFSLPYPGSREEALAFMRDVQRSLRRVRFLRDLRVDGAAVRAEMSVTVPMFGEMVLPFESEVAPTADGARLVPRPLRERAWVEVGGDGRVDGSAVLHYALSFRAHLELPSAEKWGGAAFEKMFQATARRTLERVARDFPDGVRDAMP